MNTPRTDAATLDAMQCYVAKIDHVVPAEFAAQLETEPDGMFDLVFTCPPYYKVDEYLDYDGKPPEVELNSFRIMKHSVALYFAMMDQTETRFTSRRNRTFQSGRNNNLPWHKASRAGQTK